MSRVLFFTPQLVLITLLMRSNSASYNEKEQKNMKKLRINLVSARVVKGKRHKTPLDIILENLPDTSYITGVDIENNELDHYNAYVNISVKTRVNWNPSRKSYRTIHDDDMYKVEINTKSDFDEKFEEYDIFVWMKSVRSIVTASDVHIIK